jgi:hypothetical protein
MMYINLPDLKKMQKDLEFYEIAGASLKPPSLKLFVDADQRFDGVIARGH